MKSSGPRTELCAEKSSSQMDITVTCQSVGRYQHTTVDRYRERGRCLRRERQ